MEETIVHYNCNDDNYTQIVEHLALAYGLNAVHIPRSKSMFQAAARAKRCRMVVTWNGAQAESGLMLRMCRRRGIPALVFENGLCPQNETFLVDLQGYCGDSSLNGQLSWVTSEDRRRLAAIREGLHTLYPKRDEGYILIPFQVENDTQVLYHTPFEDMDDLIAWVQRHFPFAPRRVFRQHPRSTNQSDRDFGPQDELDHHSEFFEAVAGASVVVGLTSTSLYEAAIYGTPVLALGDHPLRTHTTKQDEVAAAVLAMRIDRDGAGLVYIAERFGVRPLGIDPLEELPSTAQASKLLGALQSSAVAIA